MQRTGRSGIILATHLLAHNLQHCRDFGHLGESCLEILLWRVCKSLILKGLLRGGVCGAGSKRHYFLHNSNNTIFSTAVSLATAIAFTIVFWVVFLILIDTVLCHPS